MRRKIKQIDPNELFAADDIDRTSIKGEMRKLYPAIHQKLSEGNWSARDMVKWLDERGVSMSVELFRVYLNDLDRERGYSRSKNESHGTSKMVSPTTTPARPQSTSEKNTNGADELVRPPGISNAAWSEMQVKAKAEQRKKKLNSGE